jgi:L-rhamnose-H+ transport protein
MNILLGIFYHSLGSFSSGSFMAPYARIKKWNFENYWILMGLFAWILAPIIIAWFTVPDLLQVLMNAPMKSVAGVFLFGFFWGIGAVTFGLAVRYLGYSLGYALSLGLSSIIGTILPPLFRGNIIELFSDPPGRVILIGLLVNFVGIIFCIIAGREKDKEFVGREKTKMNAEYNYRLGIIVAVICGLFASFTGFGITAGKSIASIAVDYGASPVMSNNATLVILLIGGFLFNFLYYLYKNRKQNIATEFIRGNRNIQVNNYFFSGLSGVLWYLQYMFFGMGTTQMGKYDFASWTIHMTLIIAFSNLWGLIFKEWKLCSRRTKLYAITGISVIIFSTVIIGYSSYLTNQ